MTDTLSDLRAGCQRGEMPSRGRWLGLLGRLGMLDTHNAYMGRYSRERGLYLDALAALQEALWPGSVMVLDHGMRGHDVEYLIDITSPTRPAWTILSEGDACPTLACAWLDAILAGLMEGKNDG